MFLKKFFSLTVAFLGFSSIAMAETYLIDVRTPQEYSQDHISNAINIEYQNILEGVTNAKITPEDTILLHCRSGHRAGIAQETLNQNGYKNVVNLGGIEDARTKLNVK